jgi:hypothetical protein
MQSQRLGDCMTPVMNTEFQFGLLEMGADGLFTKLKKGSGLTYGMPGRQQPQHGQFSSG